MAYSRFGWSDIYIYPHVGGHIECAACQLNECQDGDMFPKSEFIYDDDHLEQHILEHIRSGHNVPENLLSDILSDQDRYGAHYWEHTNGGEA